MLGELTQRKEGNIIKLPNVSASIPQLNDAISELQSKGYNVPNYSQSPSSALEKEYNLRYSKVLGSAVNPVLREGNSDRRVAAPVKSYAQRSRPPVRMREYSNDSRTHVSSMSGGDFFGSEQSHSMESAGAVDIVFLSDDGSVTKLKEGLSLQKDEVIDASLMSKKPLRSFFNEQIEDAKKTGIMLSLHLKCTMMKISDPIIFGHALSVYFSDVFNKHGETFKTYGVNPNNGLGDMLEKIDSIPDASLKETIKKDIETCLATNPRLAMVDSSKGITNLHVPSDVIIDASMPPLIRDGGKMWNKDDALEDTKAMIPDRCYAGIYQAMVEDCRENGQFDHSTMGNVSNVGLMAQKAEEYGSHDKTFQIPGNGRVQVLHGEKVVFDHQVEEGDIWRMCQTKDEPIRDWVRLAVSRARATGSPAVFWLNTERAHDRLLKSKADTYLKDHDTSGLDISFLSPPEAMKMACARARAGKDTISVTGNVLRDYLTDLFPILELGTSAKMLSIVPLLKGGGLFETGAGGSAPKHVQQFNKEGHLRWDSLGEYLAVAVSLEHLAMVSKNPEAQFLSETLNAAVGHMLTNGKSPLRKVNELDNRGSTFYIAKYWAEELAKKKEEFRALAELLGKNEEQIVTDLTVCQGKPVDVGGYYFPEDVKAEAAMRPSAVFNECIDNPRSKI